MFRRLMTHHPASVGETYSQHFRTASSFSLSMMAGGISCAVHAVLPFLFKTNASQRIERLYDRMVTNRRRQTRSRAAPPVAATPERNDVVAIVGCGFSGSLLAINLLRHDGPRSLIVERESALVGQGIAYGRAQAEHLLNVRASNMSAFPDDPDHFIRWLEAGHHATADGFAGRALYGRYLRELLDEARRRSPDRITVISGEVTALEPSSSQIHLSLSDGRQYSCDNAVLAQGNLPPSNFAEQARLDDGLYIPDPWASGIAAGLTPQDAVLLVGTGLTAVDVALSLEAEGFTGKIFCLSRRGLVPQVHQPNGPVVGLVDRPPADGSHIVRAVRERAALVGWRTAIDELRPHTQDLWRRASAKTRARYLRHLRPYWDVHRHRIAPTVAEKLAHMRASGQLKFAAGKIVAITPKERCADVQWRARGQDDVRSIRIARIINCTGPQGNVERASDPLLRSLREAGVIRPDTFQLGIDTDDSGRLIDSKGRPNPALYALGPMTRGALWEAIAVPDIRRQAWSLARRLSAAHWVEGEGL